jgi:predicted AAA+ superfamily ATPase
MAIIHRELQAALSDWRASPNRKVLLLRGARQVGKTFLARQLGKTFRHFLEINFQESGFAKEFFSPQDLNPEAIVAKLQAYYGVPIKDEETLLFFDEIQACPSAISALRFFHEKRPSLHVLAAGSLLEFALAELPSFGVGRIQSMFLHPVTFKEFLLSTAQRGLAEILNTATVENKQLDPFSGLFWLLEDYPT